MVETDGLRNIAGTKVPRNRIRRRIPRVAPLALALPVIAGFSGTATGELPRPPLDLEQGWGAAERLWWTEVSQGSRLIPLAWLRALEQPGRRDPFLQSSHIAEIGYLPSARRSPGEADLPVGFAVDRQSDSGMSVTRLRWREGQSDREPWVGLNCAACHTGDVTFKGRTVRVPGAPTGADFQLFLERLDKALTETRDDPAKFSRFAASVLGAANATGTRATLATALASLIEWRTRLERQNATALRYGPARLDAVGHIMNKVALVVGSPRTKPWPADAPVSYPFIWNAPQHDRVQWNGIADNDRNPVRIGGKPTDFGALGRNTGEAIGVFADVTADTFPLNGFSSSVQVRNLVEIERLLGRLKSPAWPESILGKLDTQKVAAGRKAFSDKGCADCHKPLSRTDLTTPIKAEMSSLAQVGTDIWMACNAWSYETPSGILEGVKDRIFKGDELGQTASGALLLTAMVTGTLIGQADSILSSFARDVFSGPGPAIIAAAPAPARLQQEAGFPDDERKRRLASRCLGASDRLLAYKARPLNGIWATAPYLHNGSVPSLYDLLLPSDLRPLSVQPTIALPPAPYRPSSFLVGTKEFDPVRGGFRTDADAAGNRFTFSTRDGMGREILGNSNAGHDYGNHLLTDSERWAIVEYLKSL